MDWLSKRFPTIKKERVIRCATNALSLGLVKDCLPCDFLVQNAEKLLKEINLRDPPSKEKSMIKFSTRSRS